MGPYLDNGIQLARQDSMGSIDATVLHELNGDNYLVWKDDGNGKQP